MLSERCVPENMLKKFRAKQCKSLPFLLFKRGFQSHRANWIFLPCNKFTYPKFCIEVSNFFFCYFFFLICQMQDLSPHFCFQQVNFDERIGPWQKHSRVKPNENSWTLHLLFSQVNRTLRWLPPSLLQMSQSFHSERASSLSPYILFSPHSHLFRKYPLSLPQQRIGLIH